jgi:integrase
MPTSQGAENRCPDVVQGRGATRRAKTAANGGFIVARVTINERKLNSLAAQARKWPPGKPVTTSDAVVPGAVARVASGGKVSLGIIARFPLHPKNPTFHKIADYAGAASLARWRAEARAQLEMIQRGVDPKIEKGRQRAAALRAQTTTFGGVWSAFWDRHASKLAKADEAKRAGVAFLRLWEMRPAAEIESAEISACIREIARRTPAEARNRLGHLHRCYSWAIGTGEFGLAINPCAVLKPADLIGRKEARDRILADDEMRRVWAACGQEGYPFGPLIKLLLLTGQRLRECGEMAWGEVDFDLALWIIPKERMKMDRAHAVHLAPEALELLRSLPRFARISISTRGSLRIAPNRLQCRLGHADRRLLVATACQPLAHGQPNLVPWAVSSLRCEGWRSNSCANCVMRSVDDRCVGRP